MSEDHFGASTPVPYSAEKWLAFLEGASALDASEWHAVYGESRSILQERIAQIAHALQVFLDIFGDMPVRIVRAPGRVNLRGMHVDTHGGYLNLMTHQREIVVVFAEDDSGCLRIHNTDAAHAPVEFDLAAFSQLPAFLLPWDAFVAHPETQGTIQQRRGQWDNYLAGAACRVLHFAGVEGRKAHGMRAVVAGDIPRGAALSSSHALSVAMLLANAACQGCAFSTGQLILAARDVEWFAGARTGTSDQAAIVLGRPGKLVHAAFLAEDFSTAGVEWHDLPTALDLLVVQSHTTRNLSGAHKRAYTQNRFAYSIAFDVLRQTLAELGMGEEALGRLDRLSNMQPGSFGGEGRLYKLLCSIPENIPISELKNRYNLPSFDTAYQTYFGGLSPDEMPETINLRGPLLYGIAESERARQFAQLLDAGCYTEAGRLMSTGHDGDRVRDAQGSSFHVDLSDRVLRQWAAENRPIAECPGAYAASSPVLDLLVDTARNAGALGACLTGAGIAGSILALCAKGQTPSVAFALRNVLASPAYAELAQLPAPLTGDTLHRSVVTNHSTRGAGFLNFNGV